MRSSIAAAAAAALLLSVSGCSFLAGGNASAPMPAAPSTARVTGPAPSSPAATSPMATSPMATPAHHHHHHHVTPTPTAMPTRAMGGTAQCAGRDLTVSLGTSGAAAGSMYQQIEFKNTGMVPCTIAGYPGAALTSGQSPASQIGDAAGREPVTPHTVTLQPGQFAMALLQIADVANFPAAQGHTATSAYLQVYIPDMSAVVYLPDKVQAATVKSVPYLHVAPVTADESGPA